MDQHKPFVWDGHQRLFRPLGNNWCKSWLSFVPADNKKKDVHDLKRAISYVDRTLATDLTPLMSIFMLLPVDSAMIKAQMSIELWSKNAQMQVLNSSKKKYSCDDMVLLRRLFGQMSLINSNLLSI